MVVTAVVVSGGKELLTSVTETELVEAAGPVVVAAVAELSVLVEP